VKIKRKENFLDESYLNVLVKEIQDINFPWYLNKIDPDSTSRHFCHIFYHDGIINSGFAGLLDPILNKIEHKSIYRIKLNLVPRTNKIIEHPFHFDHDSDKFTTSLFYLNNNNGYTKFKDQKTVKSNKNRLVTFPANMLHHGTSCTNEEFRLVLNIVYE
jgi:hypothetical protein